MDQIDWVGDEPKRKPFKDLPNLRPSVAEEKAKLCLTISEMCRKVPKNYQQMGVESLRDWKKTREEVLKVAGNKRASIHELTAAINNMKRWA